MKSAPLALALTATLTSSAFAQQGRKTQSEGARRYKSAIPNNNRWKHCRKPSLTCSGQLVCVLLTASALDLKRVGDVSLGLTSVIIDQFLKHRRSPKRLPPLVIHDRRQLRGVFSVQDHHFPGGLLRWQSMSSVKSDVIFKPLFGRWRCIAVPMVFDRITQGWLLRLLLRGDYLPSIRRRSKLCRDCNTYAGNGRAREPKKDRGPGKTKPAGDFASAGHRYLRSAPRYSIRNPSAADV